jgi:TatD DNase family protein
VTDAPGAGAARPLVGPAPYAAIDTHCHLDQPQFDDDRDAVIERAMAVGVMTFVNPATNLDGCRKVLALADRYPNVYAAVGVHPNECGDFSAETTAALRDLAHHPKVVAIGEIGLDYYWEDTPHAQQKVALRAQLDLAAELRLPVILHSRQAHADLLWELEQWVTAIRTDRPMDAILGVLHAFSGDLAEAEAAYRLGFVLSLGGPVTFKNARQLHALTPHLRRERLMLETDAPYLAPHPHRGQRNEPGYLPLVIESLATSMDTTPQMLASQTTETARQCFKIKN